MSAWKPGDVAMVTHDGEDLVAVRGHSLWADRWFIGGPSRGSQHGWTDAALDDVRPLVVIDPEELAGVLPVWALSGLLEACAEIVRDSEPSRRLCEEGILRALADAFEVRPPKPEEPTGLGAVVVDANGERWVRSRQQIHEWIPATSGRGLVFCGWHEIDAVEVLSAGWSE